MFSPQDYELAARLLGLPVPMTAAEKAAAAPMTAVVMRNFMKAEAPMAGHGYGSDGLNTSATSSLNAYPDTANPRVRDQLGHRMMAGATTETSQSEVEELMMVLSQNPSLVRVVMDFLRGMQQQQEEYGNFLSAQRPPEFDLPNYGGNYSMLNAPGSKMIPPSIAYQELG